MDKRRLLGLFAAAAAAGWAWPKDGLAGVPVRVLAASDLKFALAELATRFQEQTGQSVQLNVGSSGQFVQQIRQGLPADIYMSADEEYVFQLADAGLTRGRGHLYALGRIAALVPLASKIALDAELRGLKSAWSGVRHFAIANPTHAPYGRAAQQALQHLGLWGAAQGRLVLGENIAQATQFVTSGAAQAGITALSLALAPDVARHARHVVLGEELHQPLRQRMVLLKPASAPAADFYAFLQTAAARAVLQRYGFAPQ